MENSNNISKGGKKGQEGEIRTWKGKKYRKSGSEWKPANDGGSESSKGEAKPKKEKKYTKNEMIKIVNDSFEEAAEVIKEYNPPNSFITPGFQETRDLIDRAKRYNKILLEMDADKDWEFPAFYLMMKDEETGEVQNYGIKKNHGIKKILKMLVGNRFMMTKQELKKFINS